MRSRHLNIKEHKALFDKIQTAVDDLQLAPKNAHSLMVLKFVFYSCAIGLSFWAILSARAFGGVIFGYIGFGFSSMLLAFNFAHDFSHNTFFKSKKLNNFFFELLYGLVGAHGASWKKRHVDSHHHAPNVEGHDTDLEITKLIRVIPGSSWYWFHKYQHWYAPVLYTTYSLFWIFVKDFVIYFEDVKKGASFGYNFIFWFQKLGYVFYLVGIPMVWGNGGILAALVGFLIMHLLQSLFLLFTFFITHHLESVVYPKASESGVIQSSWLMNQIKCSNDFYPFSQFANFIFGGFNNHIAHHLFPHIHHVHYPTVNKVLYATLRANDFEPNRTSYFGGVRAHIRHLRRLSVR